MGGRGASSGNNKVKAIEINVGGGTILSYRQTNKKGVFSTLQGDDIRKSNRTLNEIIKLANTQGYSVKTYTSEQLKEYDAKRKKEREETNKVLNLMSAKDRTKSYNRKGGH